MKFFLSVFIIKQFTIFCKMRKHFEQIDFYKQKINKSSSLLFIIVVAEYIFGSILLDTHKWN